MSHRALVITLLAMPLAAQQRPGIGRQIPDSRLKVDVLLVVAHPDDEGMVTGLLARAIFDQGKRVAVVFGTRGDAGGNDVGSEQAASLGAVREMEARRALAETLGILDVWFLGGRDTPSQDPLNSLETWNHGQALADLVRIVRLVRPEVMLTWLPGSVAGENHGDHQAAGVVATEAFDLAADPTMFPEQLAPPRNPRSISNLTEGLRPWQPKKLYFFSDASSPAFLNARGPRYAMSEVSPSRHVPYVKFTLDLLGWHATQFGSDTALARVRASGDFGAALRIMQDFTGTTDEMLVRGRSLVGGSVTGDVFEGVAPGAIAFAQVPGYRVTPRSGVSIELGDPWAFYREFWRAHDLDHLSQFLPQELAVRTESAFDLPVLLRNDTDRPEEINVRVDAPPGWAMQTAPARYLVAPHEARAMRLALTAPAAPIGEWQRITVLARSGDRPLGEIVLRVQLVSGGLPQ